MRRSLLCLVLAGALSAAVAGTALAGHNHARLLGNGQCVILAQDGGEKWVELPEAVFAGNPKVRLDYSTTPTDRLHPLHVLVHLTDAGDGRVWVYGPDSDTFCAGYVND
jgi:hypothetical protein